MPAGASRPPRRLALLFLLAALAGCHRDVPAQAGFYFWRTRFPPTARERAAFAALGVRTLRVRVFDVVRDSSGVHPIGKLVVSATAAGIPEVLPVVFLREQVFRPGLGAEDLARRILSESDRICHDGGLRCRGMELDCDWNATSRPGFFRTASILADSLHARGGILHATLRLHQYRSPGTTGVPPADRLTLMAYNMGPTTADPERISILDLRSLERWLSGTRPYPKPLDVALPIWSWCLQVREGRPIDLLQAIEAKELAGLPQLRRAGDRLWQACEGFFLQGRWIRKGDRLKEETVSPQLLAREAELLAARLPADPAREIVYFDLSERNLERHDETELARLLRRLGGAPGHRGSGLRP